MKHLDIAISFLKRLTRTFCAFGLVSLVVCCSNATSHDSHIDYNPPLSAPVSSEPASLAPDEREKTILSYIQFAREGRTKDVRRLISVTKEKRPPKTGTNGDRSDAPDPTILESLKTKELHNNLPEMINTLKMYASSIHVRESNSEISDMVVLLKSEMDGETVTTMLFRLIKVGVKWKISNIEPLSVTKAEPESLL